MRKEQSEPRSARRSEREYDWRSEHERRKQNWSEQDRKWRKERRHPEASDLDEALAPLVSRRFLS